MFVCRIKTVSELLVIKVTSLLLGYMILHQECIIERERRVSHSVYALYICHPWQRFTTFRWCYIVQALNRKRARDIRAIYLTPLNFAQGWYASAILSSLSLLCTLGYMLKAIELAFCSKLAFQYYFYIHVACTVHLPSTHPTSRSVSPIKIAPTILPF